MQNVYNANAAQPRYRMNLNDDPLQIQDGETTFVLNGIVRDGFYRNAKGNRQNTTLPSGFFHIGEATITSTSKVIFLVNPSTSYGEIGIFKDKSYTAKITSQKLNFRIDKQIQAKVKINYKGEVIVYFTDDNEDMRRINLNNIPMSLGDIDIDAISVFQKYTIPETKIIEVTNNGSLLSGSYFIFAQYADANGNALTSWFTPVGPIPIYKDSPSDSLDYIEGIKSNQPTDKAIKVSFNNLDTSFSYLNVGFIKLAEGVSRPFKVSTIPVSQGQYIFNGTGNTPEELTLEEVTKPVVTYKTAKTVEIADDILIWGNLTGRRTYNLQPFFNNLRVQWQVDRQLATDNQTNYANPLSSTYRRVFRFGEVYTIGIVLIYKDGSKSQVFMIPGRKINKNSDGSTISEVTDQFGITLPSNSWDTYTGYTGDDTAGMTGQPRWKLFNTAIVKGTDLSGATGPAEYGECAYYESTDLFPSDARIWGANAGQPIRLHKMPDQSVIFLHDGESGSRVEEEPVYLNYLAIKFSNIEEILASLPSDIKKEIQGWEVVVGDRTYNKSIIASGLLYNTLFTNWKNTEFGPDDIRVYPNFPFNDLGKDPYHYMVDIPGSPAPAVTAANTSGSPLTDMQAAAIFQHPFNIRYNRDIFTFLSPDTSFKKSFLSVGEIYIHGEMYGMSRQNYRFLSPFPMLFDKTSSDDDDVAIQITGTGWYNNFTRCFYGSVRRNIKDALYVPFNTQVSSGNIGVPMHNLMRESTVLVGTDHNIFETLSTDESRILPTQTGINCDKNAVIRKTCASNYASFVRRVANQYGTVYNMQYVTTNYNNYNVSNNSLVFGGDTFIGRFSAKRQMVFFQNAQTYMNEASGARPDFKNTSTIAHPIWTYLGTGSNARDNSNPRMCADDQSIGQVPVIYTGVPVFYTEADDNMTLRLNGDLNYETFYKNLQNGAIQLHDWLGIKYIDRDNYSVINPDYSALNNFTFYDNGNPSFDPDIVSGLEFYGRAIYSLSSSPEDIFDNWQIYLPRNYYDFPKNEGAIIDIKSIGNYRTLFRLENGIFMDQLYTVIATDQDGINLGDGKLFNKKPQKLATTDNQTSGTRSQWCFNNTIAGAFTADIERGIVFHISEGLKDIGLESNAGTWFMENLPLKLPVQIPAFLNTDNPANPEGIGLLSVYDSENKMWILTKRDYELVNPQNAGNYTIVSGVLKYNGTTVSLTDTAHFINRSFSIGYSVLTQGWISFFSFIPNYFMSIGNMIYSGLNKLNSEIIYSHDNIANNHSYYGVNYKHIIELVIKNDNLNSFYNLWYSFITKAFINYGEGRFGEQKFVTYNKAIVYNSSQCSGTLELIVQNENDLSTLFTTLAPTSTTRKVSLRKTKAEFNFSQVYDLSDSVNGASGFFTKKWSLLQSEYFIDKVLDNSLLDYFRDYKEEGEIAEVYTKMRLILDNRNDIDLTTYLLTNVSKRPNE